MAKLNDYPCQPCGRMTSECRHRLAITWNVLNNSQYVVVDTLTGETIGRPLVSIDAAQDMLTIERRNRGLT